MSLLVFGCPFCTSPFQVNSEQAGQAVRCPSCGEAVTVPDSDPAQATPDNHPAPSPAPPETKGQADSAPAKEPVVLACPHCTGQFGVSADMYGTQVACPHCAKGIEIRPPEAPDDVGAGTKKQQKKNAESPTSGETVPRRRFKTVDDRPPRKTKRKKAASQTKPERPAKEPKERPPQQPVVESKPATTQEENADFSEAAKPPVLTNTTVEPEIPAVENADESSVPTKSETHPPIADTESVEAAEEQVPVGFVPGNIDHLLPPAFNVLDPARLGRYGKTDQVLLPDGSGGLQAADRRIVTIMHEGQEYQLVAMTPEERRRRKIIHNTLTLVVGGLLLYLALRALGSV